MPIDTSNMLHRLEPMAPLNLGGFGGGSMERERLRLERAKFEEQKRQNREQSQLAKLEEQGRNAREALKGEQERAQREAAAQAALLADKQKAQADFGSLNAKGDIEGARAMVPYMTSLGMNVELLGEEGGLPAYQVDMDAAGAQAQAQLQQLATAAPGARPSDEVYGATEESATDSLARLNAATSIQDDTGDGVPSNVIDAGAMANQTAMRMSPLLSGVINSYPEQYRGSAEATASGLLGSGLPGSEMLNQFKALRSSPDSIITSGIQAGAQQQQFEQRHGEQKYAREQQRSRDGRSFAKEAASKFAVEDLWEARDSTKRAVDLLTNKDPTDDHLVLSLISRRMGERGATTEGDVKRVTGQEAMAWLEKARTWLSKGIEGGFTDTQRNALVGVLKGMSESDDKRFANYLDSVEAEAGLSDTDPEFAGGMRAYTRVIVPRDIREARETKKKAAGSDATTGASPIPETARIAREHNNPGNLKYVEQDGAEKGEAASDGGSWAKFKTYEDGLKALKAQVEKDASRGLTVEQFVTKYAPPGSNDTAKYIADAVKALGTEAGKKLSELDLDKVTAFVAKKESGTDVGQKKTEASQGGKPSAARELMKQGGLL